MFSPAALPAVARDWLLVNPIMHGIEYTRSGFFPATISPWGRYFLSGNVRNTVNFPRFGAPRSVRKAFGGTVIVLENIAKRYRTESGPGRWVLKDVSMTIPRNRSVGLVGRNGAGKSTLLRLIGGIDEPSRGSVERRCRVSWPLGFGGGLQGSLTGRQNVKFVCRLHGYDEHLGEQMEFVKSFSELGDAFEDPIKTYSSGMGRGLSSPCHWCSILKSIWSTSSPRWGRSLQEEESSRV